MKRMAIFALFALVVYGGAALALQHDAPQGTLVMYSTVARFLGGDVNSGQPIPDAQANLATYPEEWAVVGIGTSNQTGRNGELMPDGTASDVHFWWADPSEDSLGTLYDLADAADTPPTPLQDGLELPLLAVTVADPATAVTFTAENVDSIHDWLAQTLSDAGITIAGVQLTGEFGAVQTSIAYNIPETGVDIAAGYMNDTHFRFASYESASWTINGVYTSEPELQPLIAVAGVPLHLHGYQPDARVGGHIMSAQAIHVTATIYPVDELSLDLGAAAGE